MYFSDRFVGRRGDLATITELFARGERLITVTGPPGIGKTRLACEYAAAITRSKTCFCDVSEVPTHEQFLARVAEVLNISLSEPDEHPERRIGVELAQRDLDLIVFDGFERLVAHASTLGRWLREAPGTAFVVTSRELLRIREEVTYELLPLDVHEHDGEPSEAVCLLLDRLQRRRGSGARMSDALSAEEYALANRIATHLDGIPLAIELAAARVRTLGMQLVLDRLPFGLDLLAHGAQGHGDRQRTLRAAIAWSWDLLAPAEQATLAQCSVFCGSFSLASAEAVVNVPEHGSAHVLDHLQALREKSLVRAVPLAAGRSRFALYRSIRQYAHERLTDAGDASATELRHARFYIGELGCSHETENLDAAIRSITRHPDRTVEDLTLACDAAIAHKPTVLARGDMDRYLLLLDLVIEAGGELAPIKLAAAQNVRGDIRRMRGQFELAADDLARALAITRAVDDERTAGRVKRNQAALAFSQGELAIARAQCEAALTHHQRTADQEFEGITLADLGSIDRAEGKLDDASRRFEAALQVLRAVGDARYELVVLGNLALVALDLGEPRQARAHLERATEVCRELNSDLFAAYTCAGLGMVAHLEGRLDEAVALYEPSIAIIRASGSRRFESVYLGYCGVALLELGRLDEAAARLRHAEQISREVRDRRHESLFAGYMAMVYAAADQIAPAEACLDRAIAACQGAQVTAFLRVVRSHVELAKPGADAIPDQYIERVSALYPSFDLRLCGRIFARSLQRARRGSAERTEPERASIGELVVDARGRWFGFAGHKVLCHKRPVARRLLMRLVAERLHAPGQSVPIELLKEAGWPGERSSAHSANLRLRVALNALRNLGLRDVLLTGDGGYLLDASLPVRMVSGDEPLLQGRKGHAL